MAMNTRSQTSLTNLQKKLDALILKETKTHNENVSLKSQVAELESQSQILSNYRAVMDKIDELLPHLAKVDGGTIEGLVDYIKGTKNERKIWIDTHTSLREEKYENEEKIDELEEQNKELWGDYYELEKEVKKHREENEELKHHNYCLRQDTKGYGAEEVQEYREEVAEIAEEREELKKKVKELEKKAKAWENISKRQNAEAVKLEKDKERKEFLERHNITAADFEQLVKESDDCDLPSCEEDEVKAEDCCCVVMNKAGAMLYEETRKENEKLEKEQKELKIAVKCARSAAEQSNADYEKLVDKNNNDNLNFSDILNEREGEIVKLTKDNKALKEWVDRNQTEINRLRDVIDHPNGVKEKIVDVKDDFEWTSYIDEDILYDGTIVFYIDLDKRWVIHQEIGGTYSVAVFDNSVSGSCGVSTNNNVWCDKDTGKIAILEEAPEDDEDEERYVELSGLFSIVRDDVREGRSWRPSIFAQQTSSLYAVLQEEVDRLRCIVSLAKDKVAELEEAL